LAAAAQIGGTGWKPMTVNFKIQSPTNAPQSARYFVTNSPLPTYHCLTYSNDGAFSIGNTTLPRTEQRFNPDYTNGEIHFQAMFLCPSNENSYSIFQIHTGDAQSGAFGSTTFMAFWFTNNGGSVHDYSGTTLATNLGNKWFQLNFDHNVVTRTIRVWINQKLVWTQQDNGAGDFYIKDGVYAESQPHVPDGHLHHQHPGVDQFRDQSARHANRTGGHTNIRGHSVELGIIRRCNELQYKTLDHER